MKFDLNKAFPHPVLRHGSDDYPDAEFEVQMRLHRQKGSSAVHLSADFSLSEDDILAHIEHGRASFVLILECSMTHVRRAYRARRPTLDEMLPAGELRGLVELRPFVVATCAIGDFRAEGWHDDYRSIDSTSVAAGAVLAADEPKHYYVDNAEEAPIGSIFATTPVSTVQDGRWRCDLGGERIEIQLSTIDHAQLTSARRTLDGTADAAYLMNGIYLPALHHVLMEADLNSDEYDGRRWFRSLNARLVEHKLKSLGTEGVNRLEDAQLLLASPFRSMPCLVRRVETDGAT